MATKTLNYRGILIPYIIVRKNVKNVNLRVRPDLTVVVSAHRQVPLAFIEGLVINKAPWILKNIDYFREKQGSGAPSRYISGEIVPCLDRRYLLRVHPAAGGAEQARSAGAHLDLFVNEGSDTASRKKLIDRWYKEQSVPVFQQALDRVCPRVAAHGISRPSVTVRAMKTRWGSCSWNRGKITLNSELLKTSPACIDYVVLHELVHFKHHRHDGAFYRFLEEIMPDWQDKRQLLKQYRPGYE